MSLPQPPYEIEEKEVAPLLIAAVRMKAVYKDCGPAFAKIGKQYMWQTCGPAMFLCYDACYQEIADYEVCFPVKPGTAPVEGIDVRELPAGKCVSLIHAGPYDKLGETYEKLRAYAAEKGYELALPSREVYLRGPGIFFRGNPDKYVTDVQLMIGGVASASG